MPVSIEISKAIRNLEGDEITTLVFQEPNYGDLVTMEEKGGKELAQMRTLMICCSPYDISEINKLSPADAIKVGTKLLSFLDFQEKTTKKSAK